MSYGNAPFCRGFRLCLLYLAVFPLIAGAVPTVTWSGTLGGVTFGGNAVTVSNGYDYTNAGWSYTTTIERTSSVTSTGAASGSGTLSLSGLPGGTVSTNPPSANTVTFTWRAAPGVGYTLSLNGSNGAAGSGTPATQTFTAPPVPPKPKQDHLSFTNGTPFHQTVALYKSRGGVTDADPFQTYDLSPGEHLAADVTILDGSDYVIVPSWSGVSPTLDGNGNLVEGGGVYTAPGTTVSNGSMQDDSAGTFAPVLTRDNSSLYAPPNATAGASSTQGADPIFTGNMPSSTGALTAGIYAAGVNGQTDAIVRAIQGQRGGATDMTATNSALAEMNARQSATETPASSALSSWAEGKADAAISMGAQAAETGKVNAEGALAVFGTMHGPSNQAPAAPSNDVIDIQVSRDRSVQFFANPFDSRGPMGGVMGTLAAVIKKMIAWSIVMWFFCWCVKRVKEMAMAPLNATNYGSSITVAATGFSFLGTTFGGGVGYAIHIGLVVAITSVLLTLPMVGMAVISAGVPWSDFVTIGVAGPGPGADAGAIISAAVGIANCAIPWVLLLTSPVYFLTVDSLLFQMQFFHTLMVKVTPL